MHSEDVSICRELKNDHVNKIPCNRVFLILSLILGFVIQISDLEASSSKYAGNYIHIGRPYSDINLLNLYFRNLLSVPQTCSRYYTNKTV